MTRRRLLLSLAVVAALAVAIPVGVAQSRRQPQGLQAAERALIEGRYDEVASLVAGLDPQNPDIAAVKGRALIARGRYADAEALLKPIAQRAPTSEAALELGLLGDMLGHADAVATLSRVAALAGSADAPRELARGARALRTLRQGLESNDAYRSAARLAPRDPDIQTAWGDLFLESNQKADALQSYQAALAVDPRWEPALVGTALALADEDEAQAAAFVAKALEINPSDVRAQIVLARQAADNGKSTDARKRLDAALAVNPNSLDAYAVLAGLAYIEDRHADFDAAVAKSLAIAPRRGDVFRVAGELTAAKYRFDEAAALVRRALEIAPQDPQALADLGVHLLRTGDEPGARRALETSFELDKSRRSTITKNLLDMMDALDTFVTVTDGDLVIRMPKDEAPVLQPFLVPLAHRALDTFSKRYQFEVKGPILIEVFSKHDDFAVRNVGLPGMTGALGACFGRVVTMDSPKARPPGEFQWEAVLWHELAHVVTLQMSAQRIPRWLTEGISEYEERIARPDWARTMDVTFARLLNDGKVLKLKDLDAAFRNPETISLAYFQGSLVVEHLVNTFGDAGVRKLVRAFARGVDTETALKEELGTSFEQLQPGFDQAMANKYATIGRALAAPGEGVDLRNMPLDGLKAYAAANQGSYLAQMALANAARRAGETDLALQAFERASSLVPIAIGPDSPRAHIVDIALERNDKTRAIAELQTQFGVDFNNIEAARKLAALLREQGAGAAALAPVYARIAAIDPFDLDAHRALGAFSMQRGEFDAATREFQAALALKPADEAGARTDLAEAYFKAGNRTEARKQTLAALEIAPSFERAQGLLLQLRN